MALINCPECGNQDSNTAYQKSENNGRVEQNATTERGCGIVLLIAIAVIVIIVFAKIFHVEADHNDGKCDICKKTKYASLNGEEFCFEHYKDALDYYLED